MTKETKDLGAAPPRSLCEVCGREKYTVEPVRSIEELRRVCWRESAIQEDRDCFRLAYERAASELRSARKALAVERRSALMDAAQFVMGWHVTKGGYTELASRIQDLALAEGTAPQAPPGFSAALLDARRLLGEIDNVATEMRQRLASYGGDNWYAKAVDYALIINRLALLGSDSERSEPARSESGGSNSVDAPKVEER